MSIFDEHDIWHLERGEYCTSEKYESVYRRRNGDFKTREVVRYCPSQTHVYTFSGAFDNYVYDSPIAYYKFEKNYNTIYKSGVPYSEFILLGIQI